RHYQARLAGDTNPGIGRGDQRQRSDRRGCGGEWKRAARSSGVFGPLQEGYPRYGWVNRPPDEAAARDFQVQERRAGIDPIRSRRRRGREGLSGTGGARQRWKGRDLALLNAHLNVVERGAKAESRDPTVEGTARSRPRSIEMRNSQPWSSGS